MKNLFPKLIWLSFAFLITGCGYFERIIYFEPEQNHNVVVSKGGRGPVELTKLVASEDIKLKMII